MSKRLTLGDYNNTLLNGEYVDTKAFRMKDVTVVNEFTCSVVRWVGPQKNVRYWYQLENGYAVGMNENPSRGITFPVVKIQDGMIPQLAYVFIHSYKSDGDLFATTHIKGVFLDKNQAMREIEMYADLKPDHQFDDHKLFDPFVIAQLSRYREDGYALFWVERRVIS